MTAHRVAGFLATATLAMFAAAGAAAVPCSVDTDCDDGVACTGVETCGYDGACRPGHGLCGPATGFVGTRIATSSIYGAAYDPANLVDGIDHSSSSWCSARNDPAPSVTLSWALDVEVHEIRALTSWSPSYDFLTGRFRLFDAADAVVFDSGTVSFTAGEIALPVVPAAAGVRRLEILGETWRSLDPCLSEIEVDAAVPCATDLDCAFVSPCVAVGTCLATGSCTATAPRCRNLAQSFAAIDVTSVDPPYTKMQLVDGVDTPSASWCAAGSDATPTVTLTLPNEHPVHGIRVTAPWTGYEIRTGQITIEDALGTIVFDSGAETFDHGAYELFANPVALQAHHVRLDALTSSDAPCIGELEILGESCAIAVTGTAPLTVAFRPGTPAPEFELRFGLLAELRADGGFDRAACLGRWSDPTVTPPLPEPAPGHGYWFLARGLDVCVDEGFGVSSAPADPRTALAAMPACPP